MAGTGLYCAKKVPTQHNDSLNGAPVGQVITLTTGGIGATGYEGGYCKNVEPLSPGFNEVRATVSHTDTTVTLEGNLANWQNGDDIQVFDAWNTIQGAADQLWTDQAAVKFTASQYIRIFAGTYAENVVPNAGLVTDTDNMYALIIEGDPADARANVIISPGAGEALDIRIGLVVLRHFRATERLDSGAGMARLRIVDVEVETSTSAGCLYQQGGTLVCEDSDFQITTSPGDVHSASSSPKNVRFQRCACSAVNGHITKWDLYDFRAEGCTFSWGGTDKYLFGNGGGQSDWNMSRVRLANCTMYGASGTVSAVRCNTSWEEVEIVNCIFEGVEYPIELAWDAQAEETATKYGVKFRLRNNVFHNYTAFYVGGANRTYAQFAAYNLVDAVGDLDATDPLLTNPAGSDFRLQATSPCIAAGYGSGIPYDAHGADGPASRVDFDPHFPDIGGMSTGIKQLRRAGSGTAVAQGGEYGMTP